MIKILITGANGQLGGVLTDTLRKKWGTQNVLATDIRDNTTNDPYFKLLDVTDYNALSKIVTEHQITEIYHMAAILSANGEKNPLQTWDINMKTFFNVLEVSRQQNIHKIFFPSSIAVFGSDIKPEQSQQASQLNPYTVYGISKVAGEHWAKYYHEKYDLDIRSIRYPGVIGYQSLPGGGTTDYAVEIFYKAIEGRPFECFLQKDTALPMIFMDDAIRATIELMEAPKEHLKIRTAYNISGLSFTPSELANAIREVYPHFKIQYQPDFRQKIADTWPDSIDDTDAQNDWNWKASYHLKAMTTVMIEKLQEAHPIGI